MGLWICDRCYAIVRYIMNSNSFDLPLFHTEADAVIVRNISCKEAEKTVCGRFERDFVAHMFTSSPSSANDACFPAQWRRLLWPFEIRSSKGRGIKAYKGYVAVFVCLTVKAIHIECVDGLTTDAFLAAFHRFIPPGAPAFWRTLGERSKISQAAS